MTPRQKQVLDYIGAFWAEKGWAPSFDEIKDHMGVKSKSSVASILMRLEKRGYITRTKNLARSIKVVPQEDSKEVPWS